MPLSLPRTRRRWRFIARMWDFSLGWEFDQWLKRMLDRTGRDLNGVCVEVRETVPATLLQAPPDGLFASAEPGTPPYYLDLIERWLVLRQPGESGRANDFIAVATHSTHLDGPALRQWLLRGVRPKEIRETLR